MTCTRQVILSRDAGRTWHPACTLRVAKPLATFLRRCRRVAAFCGAPSTHLGRGSVAAGLGDCLSYAWHTERIVMMAGSAHARSTHPNIEYYLMASLFNGTFSAPAIATRCFAQAV